MGECLTVWMELKTDRRAVTALEYALIASFIFAVVIAVETLIGTSLSGEFNMVATSI